MAETLGSAVLELDTDQSKLESGLGQAEKTSQSKLGRIGGIAKGAAKVTAGAMAAAGAAAVGAAFKVSELGDRLDKASTKMGISTDALQEMEFWAQQNGIGTERLERAVGRLNQRVGRAVEGNEKYKEAFADLNVEIQDSEGNIRATEDVMQDTIAALRDIEDPALRSARASEVFGTKMARELLPALEDGSLSLEDAAAKAHELGLVMDGEAIAAAAEFGDQWDMIKGSVMGFLRDAAIPVMVWMNDNLLPVILDSIIPALRSFWTTVQEGETFLGGLMDAIQNVIGGGDEMVDVNFFDFILESAKRIFDQLIRWLTGPGVESILNTLLEARVRMLEAGMQLILSLLEAAQTFLPELITFLGETLIPNILEFIVSGVPLLLDAAVMLFQTLAEAITTILPVLITVLATEVLPSIITSLAEMIPGVLQAAIEAFLALVTAILTILPTLLETILGVLLPEVLLAIAEMLPEILPVAIDTFLALVDAIIEILPILIDTILLKVLPALVVAIIKMSPEMGQAMADASMQLAVGLLKAIPSLLKAVWKIGVAISDAVLNLRDRVWEAGKKLMIALANGIKAAVGKVVGAVGDVISDARELLPFSPARRGPLAGRGAPRIAGAKIAEDLARGIQEKMPEVRSAVEMMVQPVAAGAGGGEGQGERVRENTEIHVHNPEREPASQSISRVLREESALRGVG